MGLMLAVKATGLLRVSREGELEGLDIHEHGIPAYPEFALVARGDGARVAAIFRHDERIADCCHVA